MSVTIEVVEPKSFASAVADEIVASIDEILETKERCSLVLAGGRTPSSIYRLLARPPIVREIRWSAMDLFWGDERWVPQNHQHSNYNMVVETLLSQLGGDKPRVFPVDTSLSSPEAGAESYNQTIRAAVPVDSNGIPQFDMVVLGVGEDGHTASLFPGSSVLKQSGGICFPAKQPEDGSDRVTLSSATLCAAKRMIFIVKGESKSEVVKRILEGSESCEALPAKIYEKATGSVTWFLDSAAAKKLDQKGNPI